MLPLTCTVCRPVRKVTNEIGSEYVEREEYQNDGPRKEMQFHCGS